MPPCMQMVYSRVKLLQINEIDTPPPKGEDMTIEEAIEILSNPNHITFLRTIDEHDQALRLGIEALEWLSTKRKTSPALANIYLPSEENK